MADVLQIPPPRASLIAAEAENPGYYTDAFVGEIDRRVDLAEFINAFYTTRLFRAERLVLRLGGIRATDSTLRALAAGQREDFAAWRVQARTDSEILLADHSGRTKSWLCVEMGAGRCRLWFGSVVVPVQTAQGLKLGWGFEALLGVHRLYARLLLKAALRRLSGPGRS